MRKCFGVGICDADYNVQLEIRNGKERTVLWRCPYYQLWMAMIRRCYRKQASDPSDLYFNVKVWEGWHTFSIFSDWVKAQKQHSFWLSRDVSFCLDKDLLSSPSCTVKYHPDTSVLIPQRINSAFSKRSSIKGDYPFGVFYKKKNKRFQSQIMLNGTKTYLGLFEDPMEGHHVWQSAKIEELTTLIGDYKNQPYTDTRVVERMEGLIEKINLDLIFGRETLELIGD